MKINISRSIYTDRLPLTQDRSFTTAVEREMSQYVGTFNVILLETSSDLADNIMKVNIYLKDKLHSTILFFCIIFYTICKERSLPICWDSQYFFRRKSLQILDNVIQNVLSPIKVNIYVKTNLQSLVFPYTKSLTEFVKKSI